MQETGEGSGNAEIFLKPTLERGKRTSTLFEEEYMLFAYMI
jgi:hypothetical protein